MAAFKHIIARLKAEERKVLKQMNGIRRAIESLEFGAAVSPPGGAARISRGTRAGVNVRRRKRKFSAATRRRMALAQKARWARRKVKA
jgi:hypothetical protein